MDENGFVQFASVPNLAHRARVTEESAKAAVSVLEGPDSNSSDPDHEGRRIERIPGGWIVLNASKYREIVTRVVAQEKTRQRVARFRERNRLANGNGVVTVQSRSVTPSEALALAEAEAPISPPPPPSAAEVVYRIYPKKVGRKAAIQQIEAAIKTHGAERIRERTQAYASAVARWPKHELCFVPDPERWFKKGRYEDDPTTWVRNQTGNFTAPVRMGDNLR